MANELNLNLSPAQASVVTRPVTARLILAGAVVKSIVLSEPNTGRFTNSSAITALAANSYGVEMVDANGLILNQGGDMLVWSGTAEITDATIQTSADAALRPTVSGRTLDVSATGETGLDFDNIKQATGATTLTNITVPVVSAVGSISGVTFPAGFNNLTVSNIQSGLSTLTTAQVNAEADAALSDAGVTTVRMGYVDKLNVAGTLANTENADTFKANVSGLLTTSAFNTKVPNALAIDVDGKVTTSNPYEAVEVNEINVSERNP